LDPSRQSVVRLVYFAWVREKIGKSSEVLALPAEAYSVRDLIGWLQQRGPEYADAFARPDVIRTAINQAHVKNDAALAGAKEIAFFPPVTGG
jgi:sulfur-carrier protein